MESGIFYPGKDWGQQKSLSFLFIYLFIYLFKWEIYYSDRSVESSTQSSQLSKLSVYIARGMKI